MDWKDEAPPTGWVDPVEVTVTDAFFEEARPWHEDTLGGVTFGNDGDFIQYRSAGKSRWRLKMERRVALDLLDFSQYGADGFASGGGRSVGTPLEDARYARMYLCAARSLQKQLNAKGRLPQ